VEAGDDPGVSEVDVVLNTALSASGIAKLPVIPRYFAPVLILSLCIRLPKLAYTSSSDTKVVALGSDVVETNPVFSVAGVVFSMKLFISESEYRDGEDVLLTVGVRVPALTKIKTAVRRERVKMSLEKSGFITYIL
jgi:hypothetical protein